MQPDILSKACCSLAANKGTGLAKQVSMGSILFYSCSGVFGKYNSCTKWAIRQAKGTSVVWLISGSVDGIRAMDTMGHLPTKLLFDIVRVLICKRLPMKSDGRVPLKSLASPARVCNRLKLPARPRLPARQPH